MKALLEQTFGKWHKEASQPGEVPAVPSTPIPQSGPGAGAVYLVNRPGLTQVSSLADLSSATGSLAMPCL